MVSKPLGDLVLPAASGIPHTTCGVPDASESQNPMRSNALLSKEGWFRGQTVRALV